MFGRVAACGIAALLLLAPGVCSGEPDGSAVAEAASVAAPFIPTTIGETARDEAKPDDARQNLAALEPAEPPAPSPPVAQPFGRYAVPLSTGGILQKWSDVEADIDAENEILERCRVSTERCPGVAQKFLAIIDAGAAFDGRARIGVINRAVNMAIRPMSDLAQWGVDDRWSAPLDTLTTGRGDCEDYAIAKYVALLAAGVAAADLRLVIVRDVASGEDHAVVAARSEGHWLILDNRTLALIDDTAMRGALPLFVLGQDGVQMFWGAPPQAPHGSAPASLY